MNLNDREIWPDISKGFAILLVVIGHVLNGFLNGHMYPEWVVPIRYVLCTFYNFHMPLFFAISGYLYGSYEQRPTLERYSSLLLKKLIRFGIPFTIFSCLQGFIHLAMNGHANRPFQATQLLNIFYLPIDQFWYLYTLIACFIIVCSLEAVIVSDVIILSLLVILKFLPFLLQIKISVPFFDWFMCYGLYFYTGAVIARRIPNIVKSSSKLLGIGSILYIAIFGLHYANNSLTWVLSYDSSVARVFISVALAYTGVLFSLFITRYMIMPFSKSKVFFNYLGTYAFEIYLLHILPIVAIREGLKKVFHTEDFMLHFCLAVLAGIIIPLVIGKCSRKIKILDCMFYPNKYLHDRHPKIISNCG